MLTAAMQVQAYKFGSFFSSLLNESDFSAKPSVLLLGQYSTGEASTLPCCSDFLHASRRQPRFMRSCMLR